MGSALELGVKELRIILGSDYSHIAFFIKLFFGLFDPARNVPIRHYLFRYLFSHLQRTFLKKESFETGLKVTSFASGCQGKIAERTGGGNSLIISNLRHHYFAIFLLFFCLTVCMISAYISIMKEKDRICLLKRLDQEAFQAEAAGLWPLARGSLTLIRKPCVRPGCPACAKGVKHAAYILMVRDKDVRRCLYVPRELAPLLREAIRNGKVLERRLARLALQLIASYRAQRRKQTGSFRSFRLNRPR